MTIKIFKNKGIEIDHGDRDISACPETDGSVEISIGIEYNGETGYNIYADISLNADEAIALRDWFICHYPISP